MLMRHPMSFPVFSLVKLPELLMLTYLSPKLLLTGNKDDSTHP